MARWPQIRHHNTRIEDRSADCRGRRSRANAAVDWLIQRGVSRDRLVAVGYGEMQPTNGCTDNVPCTEEEHQRNRRTEFRVIDNIQGIDEKSIERFDMLIDPCMDCPF